MTFMICVCRPSQIAMRNRILPLFFSFFFFQRRGRSRNFCTRILMVSVCVYVCVLFSFASSNSCLFVLFSDRLAERVYRTALPNNSRYFRFEYVLLIVAELLHIINSIINIHTHYRNGIFMKYVWYHTSHISL